MDYPEGYPKRTIHVILDYRYNSGIDYFSSSLGKRSVFAWEPSEGEPDPEKLAQRVLATADLLVEDHEQKLTAALQSKESLKNIPTELLIAALEERTR